MFGSATKRRRAELKKLGFDERITFSKAKSEIKADEDLKEKADKAGIQILEFVRDKMLVALEDKSVEELRELFITMTGTPSGEGQKLPTLKLTGYVHGDTEPKSKMLLRLKYPRQSAMLRISRSRSQAMSVFVSLLTKLQL